MATYSAEAALQRADNFASDYGTSTIEVYDDTLLLASYQVAGMATANVGDDATATLDTVAPVNNVGTGAADKVLMVGGTKEIDITADVTISDTNFIAGVESSVTGLVISFLA